MSETIPVAMQLYSLREAISDDVAGTLKQFWPKWYIVEQEQHEVSPMESARGCLENIRKMGR